MFSTGTPPKTPRTKDGEKDDLPGKVVNIVPLDPKSVAPGRGTPRRPSVTSVGESQESLSVKDEPISPSKGKTGRKRGRPPKETQESPQKAKNETDSEEATEKIYPPTNGEPETSKDIENDFYDGTNDLNDESGSDIGDGINKDETWCTDCGDLFEENYSWRAHMASHHWHCKGCQVQFLHLEPFEKHMATCPRKGDPKLAKKTQIPEIRISSKFNEEYKGCFRLLKLHFLKKGATRNATCIECNQYGELKHIKKHIQEAHPRVASRKYLCGWCSKAFIDRGWCLKHEATCCEKSTRDARDQDSGLAGLIQKLVVPQAKDANNDFSKNEGEHFFECGPCALKFSYDSAWREHMARNHWGCPECKVLYLDPEPWEDHKASCQVAAGLDDTPLKLLSIKISRIHDNDGASMKLMRIDFSGKASGKSWVGECLKCPMKYLVNLSNLKRHIQFKHTNEKNFYCLLCNKGYVEKAAMQKHMKTAHRKQLLKFSEQELEAQKECEEEDEEDIFSENDDIIVSRALSKEEENPDTTGEDFTEHETSSPKRIRIDQKETKVLRENIFIEGRKSIGEESMDVDFEENEEFDDKDREYMNCPHCSIDFAKDCQWREHMACIHWACPKCQVLFLHEEPWNNHKAGCEYAATFASSGEPIFRLRIVKNYDPKDNSLKILKVKFDDDKKYTVICMHCNKSYLGTVTKMVRHIQYQHTKFSNFFCKFCDKGFVEKTRSEEHEKSCSQNPRKYNRNMSSLGAKIREIKKAVSDLQSEDGTESNMDVSEGLEDGPSRLCEMCEIEFPGDSQWRSHMASNHWGCPKCQVMYLHEEPWNQHRNICEDAQMYDNSLKNLLAIDIRKSHNKDLESFRYIRIKVPEGQKWEAECLECGKNFVESLAKLKIHIQMKHTLVKNYFCKFCNQGFVEVNKGKKHEKVCLRQMVLVKSKLSLDLDLSDTKHRDVEQTCNKCDLTFQRDYQFRQHMATSHWVCVKCKWQFLDSEPYEEHKAKFHPEESIEIDQRDIGTLDWIYQPNLRKFSQDQDCLFYKTVVIRQLDNGERSIECTACQPHDFRDLVSLRRHIIASHTRNVRWVL